MWENLKKCGFQGPNICVLCNNTKETNAHLFCYCPYPGYVWEKASKRLNNRMTLKMDSSLEHNVLAWWQDTRVCNLEAFPSLFVLSIWEVRNKAIFLNLETLPEVTTTILLQKVSEHCLDPAANSWRVATSPLINKYLPWAFFYGASQGDPPSGGAGGVVHLPEGKKWIIKFATGRASNIAKRNFHLFGQY